MRHWLCAHYLERYKKKWTIPAQSLVFKSHILNFCPISVEQENLDKNELSVLVKQGSFMTSEVKSLHGFQFDTKNINFQKINCKEEIMLRALNTFFCHLRIPSQSNTQTQTEILQNSIFKLDFGHRYLPRSVETLAFFKQKQGWFFPSVENKE